MDAEWIDEFPVPLNDTGLKVHGFPPWRKRTLYEYRASDTFPMTLRLGHDFIQPDKHFFTDMGSVPEIIQPIIPKDLHLPSFVLHDSACLHHAIYVSGTVYGQYKMVQVDSSRVHIILYRSLVLGGYKNRAALAWFFVRAFGPRWEVGDPPPKQSWEVA